MKIIIAIVTAATLCPVVLSAAEGGRETEWKRDIAACVEKVRQMAGGLKSDFDAFARAGLRLQFLGTAREVFQFEKCMTEKGWDLRDVDK